MSRDLRRDPPLPRLVFGLSFIAAGVIFWLDRIGRIDAHDYYEWWPLALIALGVAQLPYRKWVTAAWWLLVGTYFLLPVLGYSRFHLGQILGLWPILISVGGATLIMHALRQGEHSFSATAVMAGNVRKIGAQFKGGEAVAVMGGCDLDFTAATIDGEAVLDVLAFWGGIEIFVPDNWEIIGEVTPFMAGFELKVAPKGAPQRQIVVRGMAVMAGIEVKRRES